MRYFLACALVLSMTGAAAQTTTIDIGETLLAARLKGVSGPVVVFLSGTDDGVAAWDGVAPALVACARTLRYDRAGIGAGPPGPAGPVLAADAASDLAALLDALALPSPFLIVGRSLGGLHAQAFARNFPDRTAGVVLVDAANPLEPPGAFAPTVPPPPGTVAAREEAGVAPSVAALNAGPAFPPVPLVVVAATDHRDSPEREALWRDVQAATAAQSPQGRLVEAEGSGPYVQHDRPDVVIAAIRDVIARSGGEATQCDPT